MKKAAELKQSSSLLFLGLYYLKGIYTKKDVEKGIDYLERSSLANNSDAQFYLGHLYYEGIIVPCNYNKSLKYLLMASENNNNNRANFLLGVIYQDGKGIKSDIKKAIKYYLKALNIYNQYAKVNLAVLKIQNKINYSIELFEEAISKKNDNVAMYNLANIYFYNENINFGKYKNNWIELLINSANQDFSESMLLLCIVLIKKFNPINLKIIESEILKCNKNFNSLSLKLYNIMININLIKRGERYSYFYLFLKNKSIYSKTKIMK